MARYETFVYTIFGVLVVYGINEQYGIVPLDTVLGIGVLGTSVVIVSFLMWYGVSMVGGVNSLAPPRH